MYHENNIWYYKDKIILIDTNKCMETNPYGSDTLWLESISDDFIMQMAGYAFSKKLIERLIK